MYACHYTWQLHATRQQKSIDRAAPDSMKGCCRGYERNLGLCKAETRIMKGCYGTHCNYDVHLSVP